VPVNADGRVGLSDRTLSLAASKGLTPMIAAHAPMAFSAGTRSMLCFDLQEEAF
jgi:hypothetical protein